MKQKTTDEKQYEQSNINNPLTVLDNKTVNKFEKKQKVKHFEINKYFKFFTFQKVQEWHKQKYQKSKYFLILMHTRNDKYYLFSVTTIEKYFIYQGGSYLLDTDLSRVDLHTGLNLLFYHQDSSIPLKVDVNLDELNKKVDVQDKGVTLALNPVSLQGFIKSQVIEKVLKGQELTDDMAFMKKLIIISLLINAVVGFMVAKALGWV